MRLRREFIERIAGRIAAVLSTQDLVAGVERTTLASLASRAITDDLRVEDQLNDEVRDLLRQHASEIERHNVEYHEMFKKLKAKIVRERKLIL
ncbi:MAG: DUF507 family protein [Acidobacteriota bacterium]